MNNKHLQFSRKEQINHFGLIVKEWVDKILFNSHQIRTLETLRNTLLPKLITGQVRVQINND